MNKSRVSMRGTKRRQSLTGKATKVKTKTTVSEPEEQETEDTTEDTTTVMTEAQDNKPAVITETGLEGATSEDMFIPRLSIVEGSSKVAKGKNPVAKAGDIYNDMTCDVMEDVVEIVPVFYWKERKKFFERSFTKGVECFSKDAEQGTEFGACRDCKFRLSSGSGDTFQQSECDKIDNFIVLVREDGVLSPVPYVWSFSRTKQYTSKRIITLTQARMKPLWEIAFKLSIVERHHNGNDYHVANVSYAAALSDEDKQIAFSVRNQVKSAHVGGNLNLNEDADHVEGEEQEAKETKDEDIPF